MSDQTNQYWFPAKRYGWGWGPPRTWQGWMVMGIYIVAILIAGFTLVPHQRPFAFAACLVLFTAAMIAICWIKGEPPKWRWGNTK